MDQRPITYTDTDGVLCYRASGFGSCPRALWASRKGYDPEPYPAPVLAAFQAGHDLEDVILGKLPSAVTHQQQEVIVRLPTPTPVRLVGHIDGFMGDCVVDAKALSPDNYAKWVTYGWEKFDKYAWQLSVYAHATRSQRICMAVLNKETEDLSITYHEPPYRFRDMLERVLSVEEAVAADGDSTMPACVPQPFFCPYTFLEDSFFDTVALAGGMDQVRQNDLWGLANSYRSAKRRETEFKNEAADILGQIERRLKAGEDKLQVRKTGAVRAMAITRVKQVRKELDKQLLGAFLQSHDSNLTKFEKEVPVSFLKVTEVRDKKPKDEKETPNEAV